MARLNELPMASESLETLRRKMLRQNRDLAKSNNIRALRIRELENECACMLSENLELRGRILELEKKLEDNEPQRIADHAMAIKVKLEAQLSEWTALVAGLGLEPPLKRHSPRPRKSTKPRMSYGACRPSPSQRRLRDIARDIEELGHIAENKSHPRRSMNPEQILALRSEAEISPASPELGPPPVSHFIEEDPIKVDSPSRAPAERAHEGSPEEIFEANKLEPPIILSSPVSIKSSSAIPPSIEAEKNHAGPVKQSKPTSDIAEAPVAQNIKAGLKRKLAARDDGDSVQAQRMGNENDVNKALAERVSVRQKLTAKVLREELPERTEMDEKNELSASNRKPLADKSTNDDLSSPRKQSKAKPFAKDDGKAIKSAMIKSRSARSRPKAPSIARMEPVPLPELEPPVIAPTVCDLTAPVTEPVLLAPNTPEPAAPVKDSRGDTPPPADISSRGETSRPSRRNRAAISYAEPNLRDKMRRPTKELFDAVAGEGKYARRTSHCDSTVTDPTKSRREIEAPDPTHLRAAEPVPAEPNSDFVPASPLASKSLSLEDLSNSVVTERRKRVSSVPPSSPMTMDQTVVTSETDHLRDLSIHSESSELKCPDVYEFTSSSPRIDKRQAREVKRSNRRQTTSSKASSGAREDEKDGSSSRRRSMMI